MREKAQVASCTEASPSAMTTRDVVTCSARFATISCGNFTDFRAGVTWLSARCAGTTSNSPGLFYAASAARLAFVGARGLRHVFPQREAVLNQSLSRFTVNGAL